jgi:hypothetical protein
MLALPTTYCAWRAVVERGQDELAEAAAAATRSRAAEEHPGVGLGTLVNSGNGSTAQSAASRQRSSRSGNDGELPVLAVTALAGPALGAVGRSTASRRLRQRFGLVA